MNYKDLFKNLAKMFVAAVITFIVCYICAKLFNIKFGMLPAYVFEIAKITVVGIVCTILYTSLNLMFRMEYAIDLKNRFVSKLRKKLGLN